MLINELSPHPKSRRPAKRLGRGIGSGLGKTSGKGHKGQWARSGGGVPVGFEGGQMPLTRRIPKYGFTNNFSKEYSCVNVGSLNGFAKGTVITAEFLKENGVLAKIEPYGLKILGAGELTAALTVKAAAFTEGARDKITKAGGKFEIIVKTKNTGGSAEPGNKSGAVKSKKAGRVGLTDKAEVKNNV
jgi:large subunit ribosomal protein L15